MINIRMILKKIMILKTSFLEKRSILMNLNHFKRFLMKRLYQEGTTSNQKTMSTSYNKSVALLMI